MDAESWTRLNQLLDEALDLPPADRERWLDNLAPDNVALSPRLRALLAHETSVHASSFLAAPELGSLAWEQPSSHTGQPPAGPEADLPGATIGPYRLLRRIGEGGMGTVWLAARADGVLQREVALKLPRGIWPSAALVERMARERDILATLTHPNVARLYDAGVSAGGRPYLALEYVEGRSIDVYCAEEHLNVRARITLFRQVVHAVASAHARLVVHRDLKPSNILVTHDGQIKLLDFGIAKLLEEGRAGNTLTEVSGRPHTPEYASPEQIAGEPLGIASDIYSLGVLLYELLAGTRPYRVRRDSLRALETAILETDPAPPSASAAEPRVRKDLRGDLDTIVLKALKKKPAERYATVNALGDDLQAYLDGRPVLARRDSPGYRLSKFVRRNALVVGAAAIVILSLAAFAGISARQARVLAEQRRIAQTERDTARQVVRVLIDLFETTNPTVRPNGDQMPLGEFLAGAETRSLELLRATPAVRARLQQVFGLIHQTRGQYPRARQALDEALAEQRRQHGADDPEALESLQALGELASVLNENGRARVLLEESLERHRRVYGDRHERTARVLHALAPIVAERDLDEGGRLLASALEIRRATLAPNDPLLAETLGSLGGYYQRRREFDRAREAYTQALAVWPTPQDRHHPIAITILNDFASLLTNMSEHNEAGKLQRAAIDVGRQVLGPDTLIVANLVNNLGVTHAFMGRHAEAVELYQQSYEIHRSLVGDHHWRTANVARNIGRSFALQQRYRDALSWMDRAVSSFEARGADDGPVPAGSYGMRAQRAHVLFRLDRRQEALAQATAAVAALERLPATAAAWPLALSRVILGRMLIETGRPHDAEPVLTNALDGLKHLGPKHPQYAEAVCELTRARLLQRPSVDDRERLNECLPSYRSWGLAEREVVSNLERLLAGRS